MKGFLITREGVHCYKCARKLIVCLYKELLCVLSYL